MCWHALKVRPVSPAWTELFKDKSCSYLPKVKYFPTQLQLPTSKLLIVAAPPLQTMENQKLERYVDKHKLSIKLKELFPALNYKVEEQDDFYILTAPRKLTEEEIKSVHKA